MFPFSIVACRDFLGCVGDRGGGGGSSSHWKRDVLSLHLGGTSFMTGVGVDSVWKSSPHRAQNMEKQKVQGEGGKKILSGQEKDVNKTTGRI